MGQRRRQCECRMTILAITHDVRGDERAASARLESSSCSHHILVALLLFQDLKF